jgi:hypothetical protein
MDLTYSSSDCKAAGVALESRGKGKGTSFWLNHRWSAATGSGTARAIAATRDCNATHLSGPAAAAAPALQLRVGDWDWRVEARSGRDCSVVNLVAASGPHKGTFLSVPKTCDRFEWRSGDGGRARFKLTQA